MAGPLRRLIGAALCAVGTLVVAGTLTRYAVGAYRADRARGEWAERKAQLDVARARREAVGTFASAAIERGAPVAQLVIPRIGLDEIVLEGVDDDELNAGPGHLPGTPLPGARGNSVVSAHRDRHFSRLGELQLGDTIVTDSGTTRQLWRVVARRVVDREAPALFGAREPTLTLTTCWPIRYVGTAPDRLIITARPLPAARPLAQSGRFGAAGRGSVGG